MPVNGLSLRETINASGSVSDSASGTNQPAQFGSGPLPVVSTTWVYGTGANTQAPAQIYSADWYMAVRSVAATTYDNMNLYSGLTDFEGNVIAFTKIKRVDVIITAPTGSNPMLVGPQGQSNGWLAWFQAITTNFYDQCYWWLRVTNPWGWSVGTSTNTVLPVYNPNGATQTYTPWILGDH
jgi:hypothetical protein